MRSDPAWEKGEGQRVSGGKRQCCPFAARNPQHTTPHLLQVLREVSRPMEEILTRGTQDHALW